MRGGDLPIMLGCYDTADKCVVAGKDKKFGKYSLFVCRLKEKQGCGTAVDMGNIERVVAHLHFCKLETARAFRDVVIEMVKQWEEEA